MASNPITSWQIDGETMETGTDFVFLGSKITAEGDCSHEIKDTYSLKKSYDKPRQHIKKQRRYCANRSLSNQSYGFSSSRVWMWKFDHKEGWVLKNWCLSCGVGEDSPLDCKEIKPVNPKRNQSWIFDWKDWCWSWNSNTLATWCKEPTHWKSESFPVSWVFPWCWERLKAGGEGDDKGWDGWMASPTWWTWVWTSSGR